MSDIDDGLTSRVSAPQLDHDMDDVVKRDAGKQRRFEEEEEEEEEEEAEREEEEEEEEEEEDVGAGRERKRPKHRHKKRPAAARFLDVEAEVTDDDEEEEEEEEYARDDFLATGGEGEEDEDLNRRAAQHTILDRKERELDDQDLARIAQDLNKRYGRAAVRYTGDMNEVPQRLLMPSVHDPSLWQVRVKPGRERDIVFSLMRKAIALEYTARPLEIVSAFQRDSLPGIIYVEARSSKQVSTACDQLVGVYLSRGIHLVPIEEMASLLQIKKQDLTVTPGSWVRIKRGKYQGDLAQVMDITENGEDVGLKFIPRIDLNPRDDQGTDLRKRKKATTGSATMRPPQRFFNFEEVIKVYGRKSVSKRNQVYVFQNDTYKDGFIEKDFKLSALVLENVNPTLDEITRFTKGQDGAENESAVDLSIIAEASRKAAIAVLQPGDHIEVFEGEQAGVHGVVQEISQDVVTITAVGVDIDGQKVELPARSVRKRFKPGDHVKVMTGQNTDETGLVVSVADNVVTFLSDMSMQEVSVFSKDLREAAEVGSGTNVVGNYELHDLVQLDAQTVGVIFKTERDSFRVLDQNGQVRLVQPHQISMRRDSNRAIATDSEGQELRINDNVKEIDGEGRKGRVLHIHQSFFAFLHNRDIVENGGMFVTRARSLASLVPKGNILKSAGADLSKMNPASAGGALVGGAVSMASIGRGPRDRVIGLVIVIVKGPKKGYVGTIKDTNGPIARVEVHTDNRVISIEKEKLRWRTPEGKLVKLEDVPYNQTGFNRPTQHNRPVQNLPPPSWGGAKASNPYATDDARTPAWGGSRTPNPYALDGGRTPAWHVGSRTPNPYHTDGGRTPAWSLNRSPNPYVAAAGGATPARPSDMVESVGNWENVGWGTGAGASASSANDGWNTGSAGGAGDGWMQNAPTPGLASAATPTAAPTPGWTPGPAPKTPAEYQMHKGNEILSAPTPAYNPMGTYGPAGKTRKDVAELWLQDPVCANRKPAVKFEGTRNAEQAWFQKGELEGKTGYVQSTLQTAMGITATVILDDPPPNMQTTVYPPIKYLVPVEPKLGELALVLDGPYKGQLGIVHTSESGHCVLKKPDRSSVIDAMIEQLVKVQPEKNANEGGSNW